MQISKSLLVIWSAFLCIAPPCVRAADTDAQVKAREALRQKMNELQPQPGSSESVAPSPVVTNEKTRPTRPPQAQPVKPPRAVARPSIPAPAPTVAPPVSTPEVVTTPPADSEAVSKAREALRKKMEELQAQPLPETPPAAAPPVVVKPRRPARVAPAPEFRTPPAAAPAPTFSSPPGPRSPKAPSTIPEAPAPAPQPVVAQPQKPAPVTQPPVVAQPQTPAPDTQPPVATTQPQTPASPSNDRWEAEQAAQNQAKIKPKPAKAPKNMKPAPAFQPIQGPPLNISADKQQRLGELLRRYQADEITPAQYHEERAKILGQP